MFSLSAGAGEKPVIYQLFVRTFSAADSTRAGVGTFDGVTDRAIGDIKKMGVNTIWLTGIMQHASPLTDDCDVVKGNAGSPYAIRDYYATHPEYGSIEDFQRLVGRIHAAGLRVLIDLVPNHTARNNTANAPGKQFFGFGSADDPSKFFDINNNYYYLKPDSVFVPPARYVVNSSRNCSYDGVFDRDIRTPGNQFEYPAKASGDNVLIPNPDFNSWFETAKLNYGVDFRPGGGHYYPRDPLSVPFERLPSTWKIMIDVMNYWLDLGVDGFRIDIANMVPIAFWEAAFHYTRARHPSAFFLMEAYEGGPGDPMEYSHRGMFRAGADGIYAQPVYDAAKDIFQNNGNSSEIGAQVDRLLAKIDGPRQSGFVYFIENHDQIRSASRFFRGNNPNPEYAYAVSKFLFGLPGMFMLYNGQEFGEPGSAEDGKTSIFDYTGVSTLQAWSSGGTFDGSGLSSRQKNLRARYAEVFSAARRPAIAALHSKGNSSYINLNTLNAYDYRYQKGLAAYARFKGDDKYLVVANLNPEQEQEFTLHFTLDYADVLGVLGALGISNSSGECWRFKDVFTGFTPVDPNAATPGVLTGRELWAPYGVPSGLYLGRMAPLSVYYLKVERCS